MNERYIDERVKERRFQTEITEITKNYRRQMTGAFWVGFFLGYGSCAAMAIAAWWTFS